LSPLSPNALLRTSSYYRHDDGEIVIEFSACVPLHSHSVSVVLRLVARTLLNGSLAVPRLLLLFSQRLCSPLAAIRFAYLLSVSYLLCLLFTLIFPPLSFGLWRFHPMRQTTSETFYSVCGRRHSVFCLRPPWFSLSLSGTGSFFLPNPGFNLSCIFLFGFSTSGQFTISFLPPLSIFLLGVLSSSTYPLQDSSIRGAFLSSISRHDCPSF